MKKTVSPIILSSAAIAAFMIGRPVDTVAEPTPQHITGSNYAPVVSPKIPLHINFCENKVDLDRNDMYERFDRELTSLI